MTWNTPTLLETSTSTAGSGTSLPGYFINFSRVTNRCNYSLTPTVSKTTTITYSTSTLTNETTTKTTTGSPIGSS
ncbi:hypothetical protein JSY14_04460 [Brachybacterium sp. EF45031]|uniref:hypothetical protein n=1 Tax=Brachybacterium sillae TaxID=2810536 RepID=UPI00217E7866|nr:hypothetical protein [Brachybacterium sillae]MCS6711304.1 hypothetical protein [Brachybacterium sillae]